MKVCLSCCLYVCDPMLLALCVSDRQFEKHGSTTTKATSGQVIDQTDNESFLSKLTSLKRKIFG